MNGAAGGAEAVIRAYAALTGRCALIPALRRDRLVASGPDRVRFVNGLVTCDVKMLEPGCGALGFFTSQKGRVIADVVIRAGEEALELDVPPGRAEAVAAHVLRYRVADRVEVTVPSRREELLLAGPDAAGLLREIFDREPPSGVWSHATISGLGISREGWIGVPLYRVRGEAEVVADLISRLAASGVVEVDSAAVDAVRVERGRPLFGSDFGDESLPQETGRAAEAVSFTKGCYLGQEIVARIHYRGRVGRELQGLQVGGGDSLSVGDEVLFAENPVGVVSTAAFSPRVGQWIGLATLHRSAEPGSRVRLPDGTAAEVVELPFVESEDGAATT